MITNELLNYIKNQILSGVERDEIRDALFSVGWKNIDIEEAFSKMNIINTNIVKDIVLNKEESIIKKEDKNDKPSIESAVIDINKLNSSNNPYISTVSDNTKNKYKRSSIIIMLTLLLILLSFAYFMYQIIEDSKSGKGDPAIPQNMSFQTSNPNLDQGQYIENMYNKNTSTSTASSTQSIELNH